jgi:hypothetical protein
MHDISTQELSNDTGPLIRQPYMVVDEEAHQSNNQNSLEGENE